VDLHNRPLQDLLDEVGSQTQVSLTVAARLAEQEPVFGGYAATQAPAWRVLREVANNFVVDGSWEVTEDGYSLQGSRPVVAVVHPPTAVELPPQSPWRYWLASGSIAVIVGVTGWLVWRRRPAQTSAVSPPSSTS
jgi:hypothetical protein